MPATLQATIAARIDRLDPKAKRTLSAAAVVGSRFGLDLLTALGVEPVVADLVAAELIDQVRFTRQPEYVFHHPLIRAVAYESQLKSDRAELHRRVAAAIEERDPASVDENAALIAEHLEAAGDLRAAYGWHMRAGAWSATRDVVAAWASWERARQVADALPADDADRTAMRIAARALLCGNAFRVHVDISGGLFRGAARACARPPETNRRWPSAWPGWLGEHMTPRPGARGVAAGLRNHGAGRVDRQSDLDGRAVPRGDHHQDSDRRDGRGAALVADRHRPGRRRPRQGERRFRFAVGGGAGHARHRPVGAGPCGVARRLTTGRWPWPAAPTRCRMPSSSRTPTVVAIAGGVLLADDAALRDIEEALEITERSSEDFALGFARCTLGYRAGASGLPGGA